MVGIVSGWLENGLANKKAKNMSSPLRMLWLLDKLVAASHLRVEGITQAITEEVEGEHDDEEGERRK